MSEEEHKTYIVHRIKKIKKGGHHGGSWKIAYADFVTAMMTFFLLMWLLSLVNKYKLDGVAEYFKKPLKDAFTHQSDKQNKDKDKEKNKEKEKEKQKEKEKEKEKSKMLNGIPQNKDAPQSAQQAQADSDKTQQIIGIQGNSKMAKSEKVFSKPSQNFITKIGPKDAEGESTQKQLNQIKMQLVTNLEKDPIMRQYKNQLNFIVTADGLKIELHDLENKPMFSVGKSDFKDYAKSILGWLSKQLNEFPSNRVVIIGHTDTLQYSSENYSNWELSADRANATRRELLKSGMKKDRIMRIIGVGDTELVDKKNGLNPTNRRIEILVISDDAMKKMDGH